MVMVVKPLQTSVVTKCTVSVTVGVWWSSPYAGLYCQTGCMLRVSLGNPLSRVECVVMATIIWFTDKVDGVQHGWYD